MTDVQASATINRALLVVIESIVSLVESVATRDIRTGSQRKRLRLANT